MVTRMVRRLTKSVMFQVDGIYEVNPVTGETIPSLKYLTVTEDIPDGEDIPIAIVWPIVRTTGPYRNAAGDLAERLIAMTHIPRSLVR